MYKIFSKTSLRVLPSMGIIFVNALILTFMLFSNITSEVQARTENMDDSESVRQKSLSAIGNVYPPHRLYYSR
jgi:hypothetical protein